ncbi:hypothetical protein M427DRAFT_130521 [Gonapodya prolifera JEL478]|uniref:Uncharacterized protein n=1 Tax=Gonapodya prolifera (strain JEL478) TaxID=1344416 RepID=A0A139AYP1_GONPJ|nr:hypothetical protein M427DRAFT_130521 [Gonapodya prolifera JEL478]|eukprot:KXS21820.1 hypothetical protein M427DRAFT_130521 [Gonapodya prolifera JEL478]
MIPSQSNPLQPQREFQFPVPFVGGWMYHPVPKQPERFPDFARDFHTIRNLSVRLSEENWQLRALLAHNADVSRMMEEERNDLQKRLEEASCKARLYQKEAAALRNQLDKRSQVLSDAEELELKQLRLQSKEAESRTVELQEEKNELMSRFTTLKEEVRAWESLASTGEQRITQLEEECRKVRKSVSE